MHVVTFEQLLEDPLPALKSLMEFILKVDDITGTKVYKNIIKAIAEKPQVYKPRSGKVGQNKSKFND